MKKNFFIVFIIFMTLLIIIRLNQKTYIPIALENDIYLELQKELHFLVKVLQAEISSQAREKNLKSYMADGEMYETFYYKDGILDKVNYYSAAGELDLNFIVDNNLHITSIQANPEQYPEGKNKKDIENLFMNTSVKPIKYFNKGKYEKILLKDCTIYVLKDLLQDYETKENNLFLYKPSKYYDNSYNLRKITIHKE